MRFEASERILGAILLFIISWVSGRNRGLGFMVKSSFKVVQWVVVCAGFLLIQTGYAQKARSSPPAVISELMESQGVSEPTQLECDQVSDEAFEQLGRAVAQSTHMDSSDFAMMHRMMGGEGSETARNWYRQMGARYLGCYPGSVTGSMQPERSWPWSQWDDYFQRERGGGNWWGRGPSMGGSRGMMHGYGFGHIVIWLLVLAAVILAIVLIVKNLGHKENNRGENARDILEKRFARGEISAEEYRRMKEDLR